MRFRQHSFAHGGSGEGNSGSRQKRFQFAFAVRTGNGVSRRIRRFCRLKPDVIRGQLSVDFLGVTGKSLHLRKGDTADRHTTTGIIAWSSAIWI